MNQPIRWGILSAASIARRRVVPAMKLASNSVVTAVASRTLSKAQAFAAELGLPKAYGSYEELIADPDIDAIYNPLPNSEHAAWSIRCAEAGKPVLCEKPLASDAPEAQTMVDAFVSRGVPLAEAFMYRFHPQTVKVLEMVKSGAVGDLRVIDSSFTFLINDEANVRLSKPLAGGGLMDVGCYCVNLMRLVTGEEPLEAKAIANFGAVSGVDESLVGVLRFPSGVVAHLDCGLRAYKIHSYEIRGTTGRIVVEDSFPIEPNVEGVIHWWHGNSYETVKVAPANHYTTMTEDFADALLHNRPPRYSAQDGVLNMRAIDMLYASAR